jgi:TRAP transporter TAXI family solute receptor
MPRRARKQPLTIWAVTIGVCLLALVGTYFLFVKAPAPRHIVIASGSPDGAYYRYAQEYAELLKKDGVTLEVRATKGSVENLKLLTDEDSGVGVAILQSGVADPAAAKKLSALGSLYREPLWIFYRGEKPVRLVSDLAGKRLAVGPPGSGTRVTALQVLGANGITPDGAARKGTKLLDITGSDAAKALRRGDLDAAFFVAAIDAPYVRELMSAGGVQLLSMTQHDAYQRRYRQFSRVTVPAGLIDLGRNIPARDTELVGPSAVLVVRKGFPSELVWLLLGAAEKVHGHGTLLAKPGEFPSSAATDLPLHDDAAFYYKYGPPLLHRVLPFGLASQVDRLKIMLIPLVMLLMPLLRMTPPLMRWRIRRKIYRWYGQLRDADETLLGNPSPAELHRELDRLRAMEDQVATVDVPLSYMGELYHARMHLAVVRERIEKRLAEKGEVVAAAQQPA